MAKEQIRLGFILDDQINVDAFVKRAVLDKKELDQFAKRAINGKRKR